MEDKAMERVLVKWAKNEEKLKKEVTELKKELSILRKIPTPEDFQEEYEKLLNYFIQKLKKKTYWVNGHSQLCNEIDELKCNVFHATGEKEDKK